MPRQLARTGPLRAVELVVLAPAVLRAPRAAGRLRWGHYFAGRCRLTRRSPRRLYQIREGSVFSGVCKGLAAYLNLDVSVIRHIVHRTGGRDGRRLDPRLHRHDVRGPVRRDFRTTRRRARLAVQCGGAHHRAKTHYAAFKESEKWRRKQWREERRMWNDQRKQWKQERKAWERAGSAYGAPPPPPPPGRALRLRARTLPT